mgnify:CR=1 FL=1
MKKIIILALALFATACSFDIIPPAHKGKVLTTAGYSPELLAPGKTTLWGRDTLVLLETGTNTVSERMSIIMQDKLTLSFDVKFRSRISGNATVIDSMFNDITPFEGRVSWQQVYDIYGKQLVRKEARSVVNGYTVEDVHKNYDRISSEIFTAVSAAMEGTPLEVSDVSLGSITYPEVITKAVDLAKQRELQIKQEEAQAAIDLVKKENEKRLAQADYDIEITKAKAIRDKNKIIAEGVTSDLLELRKWEVMESLGNNKNVVFMPVEGLTSIGAQQRIYNSK